jgi:hypothetical protein
VKYLLLAYYHEAKWDELPVAEKAAIGVACEALDEDLRRGGHVVAMGSLAPTRMTASLRPRAGKTLTTDGPYVETKEQLGGLLIIEARDMNEAIRVASRHPAAVMNEHLGWGIELRPFERYEPVDRAGGRG